MSNEKATVTSGRFAPGHVRVGGRKKTVSRARELAEKFGDPLAWMLKTIQSGVYDQVVIGEDGKARKVKTAAPLDLLIDCAKCCTAYIHPKLSATQLTGVNEGPIQTESQNLVAIMLDPVLARQAQELALAICEANTQPRLETPIYYPGLKAPEEQ